MKLLLCVIALCLGCVRAPDHLYVNGSKTDRPVREIPVWIDTNFTPQELAGIFWAMELWNTSFNGYVVLQLESTKFDMDPEVLEDALMSDGFLILRVDSTHPVVSHDSDKARTLAWANQIGGNWIYMVHDRLTLKSFRPVMLHELGHLFGAVHGGTYLMNKYYSGVSYDCIDNYTAKQVEAAQHLPELSVSYCDK